MSQVAQGMVGNFANTGRESIWQRLTRLNLYAITLLSLGMFDPRFYGSSAEELGPTQVDQSPSLQQYLLLGFWITIIACTFAPKVLRRPLSTRGLLWPILFLFYMAASVLWADDPLDAATKAMVFVITSVGVWRLTSVFTLTDFFAVLTRSLYGLMIASAALIILYPQIAINHEWLHEGDWQGIFGNKQELGITAAFFVFLTLMGMLRRCHWTDVVGFVLGLVLLIGSGSRGAAVVSVVAPLGLLVARRYPRIAPSMVIIIIVEVALVLAGMAYLVFSGNDTIWIGDISLDFTERTFIWAYALDLWQSRPWLGFGINGFWTQPQILWGFARIHGWVLDNYHNGYLAILVETGAAGMVMFLALCARLCSDLRYLLGQLRFYDGVAMSFGFLIMLFTVNLTETVFLRSTNFGQVAFTFLVISIMSLRHAAQARSPSRRRVAVPLTRRGFPSTVSAKLL